MLSYHSKRWTLKKAATSAGSLATYTITVDMGGRFADFPLEFTQGTGSQSSGFSVAFEENAKPFRFARQ
jgi:hypothetical protein